MKQYANLHSHTTHSDGVYTPSEIVSIAKQEGYKAIAITDHDVVTAFPEMRAACEKSGMEFLFGAEFSSFTNSGENIHIVGFQFNPEYPEMKEYLRQLSYNETHQTQVLFERGQKEGLIEGITWEEVLDYNNGITWLCNEHVFRTMKAKGLKKDIDYRDFFCSVYGDRRGEVPQVYPFLSPEKLIKLIHRAGGLAIFAHPGASFNQLEQLVKWGIDGLEVWYNDKHNDNQLKIYQLEAALKYGLFVAGGSDHSGLCSGQYARYEKPESSEHYVLPCSLGTTEFFFRELQAKKLSEKRKQYVLHLLKIYQSY